MVKLFLELKDLWWFMRACLILIFLIGLYQETQNIPFFEGLAKDHSTISSVLIALTITCFISPFVKIKSKDNYGGERVMKKLTILAGLALIIIGILIYFAIAQPNVVGDTLRNNLGPLGVWIMDGVATIQANPIVQQNGILLGAFGGIAGTLVIVFVALPKVRTRRTSESKPDWQSAPTTDPIPIQTKKTVELKKEVTA